MTMPKLTHCPHCGEALFDERLDENGYPKLDSEWIFEDEKAPAVKLVVRFVEPGNRNGREIRGSLTWRTKKSGTEWDDDGRSETFSTDLETFHKTWNYKGKRDYSLMTGAEGHHAKTS